jgi:serine/threonine-protein kinase RsbW
MVAFETVSVPATPDGIRRAADAFEAFGASRHLTADVRWRFQVAIDEVLSNIVRHGYRGGAGEVELSFGLTAHTIDVAIADSSPPFDPLSFNPPPGGDLDHRPAGGRGIALVRSLMDDVRYERREERNHLLISVRVSQ